MVRFPKANFTIPRIAYEEDAVITSVEAWSEDITDWHNSPSRSAREESHSRTLSISKGSVSVSQVTQQLPPRRVTARIVDSITPEHLRNGHCRPFLEQRRADQPERRLRLLDHESLNGNNNAENIHGSKPYATLQQADALIDRLAFELSGLHAELRITAQATRRKRERMAHFFGDVSRAAKEDPKQLRRKLRDWSKAIREWDCIEQPNHRSDEVGSLLQEVRSWKGGNRGY